MAAADRTGDASTQAWAELWLGRIAFFKGELGQAADHLQRALDMHEKSADALGLVRSLSLLGLLQALILGRHAAGKQKLERAVRLAGEIGDSWGQGYAHMMLGLCAADAGDLARGESHSRAALNAATLGPLLGVPLQCMARVAVERDPGRTIRLLAAADAHFRRSSTVPPPFLQQRSAASRQRAQQLIGDVAAARASEQGAAMTTDEALHYALDTTSAPQPSVELTRRETQVASLVARGQTNRDIAGALYISVRTAESHVDHVLTKLALRNRTELAAWARENLPAG
jgi:DNA-binding CsgD family transcriptional regulator